MTFFSFRKIADRCTVCNTIQLSEICDFAFPRLPGSAEAQVIWGGIVKCLLIAYFIGNISAKKISKSVHVCQSSGKKKVGRFLRHGVQFSHRNRELSAFVIGHRIAVNVYKHVLQVAVIKTWWLQVTYVTSRDVTWRIAARQWTSVNMYGCTCLISHQVTRATLQHATPVFVVQTSNIMQLSHSTQLHQLARFTAPRYCHSNPVCLPVCYVRALWLNRLMLPENNITATLLIDLTLGNRNLFPEFRQLRSCNIIWRHTSVLHWYTCYLYLVFQIRQLPCKSADSFNVLGRPFIKRGSPYAIGPLSVCLSVCSVCSVCDVGVLWSNGWTVG